MNCDQKCWRIDWNNLLHSYLCGVWHTRCIQKWSCRQLLLGSWVSMMWYKVLLKEGHVSLVKKTGQEKQDNKKQGKGWSSVRSSFSMWCRLEKSAGQVSRVKIVRWCGQHKWTIGTKCWTAWTLCKKLVQKLFSLSESRDYLSSCWLTNGPERRNSLGKQKGLRGGWK